MKKLLLLLIAFSFVSCAIRLGATKLLNDEYEIVGLALSEFKTIKSKQFRLIEKPENSFITDYLNGLNHGPFELPGLTFSFIDKPAAAWDKKRIGKTVADKQVVIIEDFKKIPKAPLHESEKSEIYFSLSNPIFSNDGQYALINLNNFFNHAMSPSEGYIMVFKKENEKWVFQYKFPAYFI